MISRFIKNEKGIFEIINLNDFLFSPESPYLNHVFLTGSEEKFRLGFSDEIRIFYKIHLFADNLSFRLPNFNKDIKQPAAYVIFDTSNDIFYIGSTGGIYRRILNHRSMLISNTHFCKKLADSYQFNKKKSFHVIIIFATDKEDAFSLEQKLLDIYFKDSRILNVGTDAKLPTLGVKYNEKKLINRSILSKKIWSDPERRQRMSNIKREQLSSSEVRQLQSDKMKLHFAKPGKKEAQSERTKLHFANPENRTAQSERTKAYFANPENRQKQSLAHAHRSSTVNINDTIYPSLNEAGRQLNIHPTVVRRRIKSKNPQYANWKCA